MEVYSFHSAIPRWFGLKRLISLREAKIEEDGRTIKYEFFGQPGISQLGSTQRFKAQEGRELTASSAVE